MKRRSFLTATTLASLGIATIFVGSCADVQPKNAGANDGTDPSYDFELDEKTISDLGQKLTSGKYTSEELVNLYLKRILFIAKTNDNVSSNFANAIEKLESLYL